MAKVKGMLKKGLILGDVPQKEFRLKSPTAGDIIEAQEASEKPVYTNDGYQMVSSPALMGAELLCRQVLSIGEIKGPLELHQLKLLSVDDLSILNSSAERLEQAAFSEVTQRGRDDSGSKEPEKRATAPELSDSLDETRPLPNSVL